MEVSQQCNKAKPSFFELSTLKGLSFVWVSPQCATAIVLVTLALVILFITSLEYQSADVAILITIVQIM